MSKQILCHLITAIMGKASKKPKSEAQLIENEKNLTKRYESITEKKYEENVHPTSEKGNETELDKGKETEFSPMSRKAISKTVVDFYQTKPTS